MVALKDEWDLVDEHIGAMDRTIRRIDETSGREQNATKGRHGRIGAQAQSAHGQVDQLSSL